MNTKPISIVFVVASILVGALLLASFQSATATHTAVAIVAYPAESVGQTRSLARVYMEPDDSSTLVQVMPPGKQVQVLGLSENGAWVAIAKDNQAAMGGWISKSNVNQGLIVGATRSLVKSYQQPDSSSVVAATFSPETKLEVLGHNADNTWIAIARPGSMGTTVNWVASGDLKMPDVLAATSSLTRLYLRPDSKSQITNVLPPAQKVILIGRNNVGNWYAVADIRGSKFIGWVQLGDLKADNDKATLPILPAN